MLSKPEPIEVPVPVPVAVDPALSAPLRIEPLPEALDYAGLEAYTARLLAGPLYQCQVDRKALRSR